MVSSSTRIHLAQRKGYFETDWGNVAYVASSTSKTAKDLDSGERIPVCLVDFSKPARQQEKESSRLANPEDGI